MVRVEGEIVISRPVEEVFDFVADDPVADGTQLRWSWELEPRGILKLLSPMVARMGRSQEQRIWTGLKRLLEKQRTPPVSS